MSVPTDLFIDGEYRKPAGGQRTPLVNPATDPISGQPESKHTPVKAAAYLPKWHAFILSRQEIERPEAGYWVGGLSGTCWRRLWEQLHSKRIWA